MRPWHERLAAGGATLEALNSLVEAAGVRTEGGRPVRFVPPGGSDAYYEMRVFETGRVETRPQNRHDLFNALAWLAFPKTKARINAMHAAAIPRERSRRGPLRDALTLLDEGGVIVECDDRELIQMLRGFRWKELFWGNRHRVRRAMRIQVLGHAVLDAALKPWPGITCKAIFVQDGGDADAQAAAWLAALGEDATPRELAPLPIFGYPGWFPGNDRAGFYGDTRYFRPFRKTPDGTEAVELRPGVG